MGTGEAEGENRAIMASEMAISSPLLDGISMTGAKGVLINITGGPDMTLYEVDEAANRIREEVDPDANIIFGTSFDSAMEGKIRVSVVATGLGVPQTVRRSPSERSMTFGLGTPAVETKPVTKTNVEMKHEEPVVETPIQEEASNVEDFASKAAAKQKEREEDAFDDLEIPAFLRRQAN
jgi:cell division protein FtsZ